MATAAAGAVALLTVPLLLDGVSRASEGEKLLPPPSNAACKAESAANLNFTLKDMNGAAFKLADYKGKVILLNFWGTWCGPCKMEIPAFVQLQEAYRDKGFVIIGIAVEDTPEAVRAYAAEAKMNYPLAMVQDDLDTAYGPLYGLPMSFFIARDGSICKKHLGPITKEAVEKEIKSLL
jgi:cytochrome c biogenesis protein CcmG/thiol:disulfide interchange protein DsbE